MGTKSELVKGNLQWYYSLILLKEVTMHHSFENFISWAIRHLTHEMCANRRTFKMANKFYLTMFYGISHKWILIEQYSSSFLIFSRCVALTTIIRVIVMNDFNFYELKYGFCYMGIIFLKYFFLFKYLCLEIQWIRSRECIYFAQFRMGTCYLLQFQHSDSYYFICVLWFWNGEVLSASLAMRRGLLLAYCNRALWWRWCT